MRHGGLLLVAGLALTVSTLATAQRSREAGKAIYAASQASEGARIYAVRCAMCHGRTLDGSVEIPGLKGKFMANWAGRPVGDLFDYVAQAMPQPAPGTLADIDNARLVAFILSENGLTAGSVPLAVDRAALRRIVLAPVPPR